MTAIDFIKVIAPTTVAFVIGIISTPIVTHYLYTYRMWKKKAGNVRGLGDDTGTPLFNKLHKERDTNIPRMGGIVIWFSALITILLFWLLPVVFTSDITTKLNFFSRNQTWLPVFTLLAGALVGLIDDYFTVREKNGQQTNGLSMVKRIAVVTIVGLIGAWWFFTKLEVSSILIPFVGEWEMGFLFIPFFVLVVLGTFSGGIIDGIDGLSGGVFASIFSAYGIIAFFQQQFDLAAFAFVLVGGLLAFLWFNIPPARFYMGETGIMAITMTLAVIAFLTRQVLVLPIVALLLVVTSLSTIIQVLSKKCRAGKKVFLVSPLHHHLEACGWPPYKVTMRYWVLAVICAVIGVLIALLGA